MTPEEYKNISSNIPGSPGIYKYFDIDNNLIYVGKAKSLRKRVTSYFIKTFTSYKTYELVQRIARIEFTIVNSEQDAFLLENSLIKQFQPRFNINLKDDKSYPFIVIKNEPFPRVFLTRKKINDGSEDLGPYTSIGKEHETAFVNFWMVRSGTIVQTKTLGVEAHLDENAEEILSFTIGQLRTNFASLAKEVIVPFLIEYSEPGVVVTVPRSGDKKK